MEIDVDISYQYKHLDFCLLLNRKNIISFKLNSNFFPKSTE